MERNAAIRLIDQVFDQPFDQNTFVLFIRNLLGEIDESKGFHVGRAQIKKAFNEHIVSYRRLASYTDPEGETLDILIVKLERETALDRARTMQRNFVADYLKQRGEKDAALVAYFHPDSPDWRFSFVQMEYSSELGENGKIRVKEELTPARRYSFLVGVNEPNHTARTQLVPLLQSGNKATLYQIEQAFNIESVTREFFEKYKQLFLKLKDALDAIVQQDAKIEKEFNAKSISTADFAKKLLGQIVFLYFLQKKGWLGVGKDAEGILMPWGSGPKNFLRQLFDGGIIPYDNFFDDILEPLFYEALAVEHDNNFYSRFNCRIPFLNGGLFEPMQGYNWQEIAIRIENSVFSEIFSVFNEYNFTVREDEPLEREVAVDPEMLGKVFENLLEIKDRKSRGAFYTPRDIVHFMCRESLINYLAQGTASENIPVKDIDDFIRRSDIYLEYARAMESGRVGKSYQGRELPASILEHAEKLDNLLAEIKICDPAIGSGAFPLGILNEIVRARQLLEVYLKRGNTAYTIKRRCIQESIYGVDIDGGAIDIAKLRLWLSLVVDEDDFSNIQPLPNLDYKIMQGNSLLEQFEGITIFDEKFLSAAPEDNEKIISGLKEEKIRLEGKYIRLHQSGSLGKAEQARLNQELHKLDKAIKKRKKQRGMNGPQPQGLFSVEKNKAAELKKLHTAFFNATRRKEKARLRREIERLTFELIRTTLQEQGKTEALARIERAIRTNTRPFFLWKLNFSEVFQEKGGFDVVIGNPPYVRHEGIKEMKPWLKGEFDSFYRGTADLYTYFYKRGLEILHAQGHLAFIAPNKFMRAAYGVKTRELLTTRATPKVIIDFGDLPVFDATTYPAILVVQKGKPKSTDTIMAATFTEEQQIHQVNKALTETGFTMPVKALTGQGWNLEPPEVLNLMEKLRQAGTPLDEYVKGKFYRGILTGLNKAFIIDEETRKRLLAEDPKSAELIKPWLRGRDIRRWQVEWAGLYIIFTRRGVDIEKYPAIKRYLEQFREDLEPKKNAKQKKGRKPGSYKWYEIQDNIAYYKEFEQPKIVWRHFAVNPDFVFDEESHFSNDKSYILPTNDLSLLGVLNSSAIAFFIKQLSPSVRGGYHEMRIIYLQQVPIVKMSEKKKSIISDLVQKILLIKQKKIVLLTKIIPIEQEIDARIAHLYNLTENEYNLILHKTNTPDPFRVGALNIFRDLSKGIIQ